MNKRDGTSGQEIDSVAVDGESPLKSIMVATDLSARSDRALERAVILAKQHTASLTVLHVVASDRALAARERTMSAAKADIETAIGRAGGGTDLNVAIEVIAGKGHKDILATADRVQSDLIITGVHRNESGRRPITGTTMERVVRGAAFPVLVVAGRAAGPYARIMIGADFSDCSREAIRSGLAIAPDVETHILHAFNVPFPALQPDAATRRTVEKEHEQKMADMLEEGMVAETHNALKNLKLKKRLHTIFRHGDARLVLRKEVDRVAPDLLVLGTHGRAGIAHAIIGSVAEDFLNAPPCDVLVVKAC